MGEDPNAAAAERMPVATARWRRRDVLVRGGGAVVAAWAVPSIVSVPAAHAQGSVAPTPLRLIAALTSVNAWYSDDGGDTSVAATIQPTGTNFLYGTDVASDGASRLVMSGWEQDPLNPDPPHPVRAWTSTDHGVTWSAVALPASTGQAASVATDGLGTWVIAGVDSSSFLRSPDGLAWSAPTAPPAAGWHGGVATDGTGTWVGVGDGTASTSTDGGDTWSPATTPPDGLAPQVATDGAGTWVAGGVILGSPNELAIWRSLDDGDSWARMTAPTPATSIRDLIHDAGTTWLACTSATVYSSDDGGLSWSATAGGPANADTLMALASNGAGRWIVGGLRTGAVGGGPGLWWSVDGGLTWDEAATPPSSSSFVSGLTFDRLLP